MLDKHRSIVRREQSHSRSLLRHVRATVLSADDA